MAESSEWPEGNMGGGKEEVTTRIKDEDEDEDEGSKAAGARCSGPRVFFFFFFVSIGMDLAYPNTRSSSESSLFFSVVARSPFLCTM